METPILSRKNLIIFGGVVLLIWASSLFSYSSNNEKLKNEEYLSNCSFTFSEWIFTINANCIKQKQLPQLSLVNIINEVWDQIEWFSGYYEPYNPSFNYHWATPKFKTKWSPYLQWNEESNQLIDEAIKWRKKIQITYNELSQYYAQHLLYAVADKDLKNLWRCTRINYTLALEWMDGVIMNPWDIFNVNDKLSSLNWYCRWMSEDSLSFYGGVCGMVSQLFRVSLLSPNISINKRFSHNEWFVQYYGEKVWWDDAAVYEYSKQFEIQNISNSDIVFKMRHEWDESMLIAISWPTDEWVNISKENIDWRETAIHLTKNIYEWDTITRQENFDSYYTKKTYEFR